MTKYYVNYVDNDGNDGMAEVYADSVKDAENIAYHDYLYINKINNIIKDN